MSFRITMKAFSMVYKQCISSALIYALSKLSEFDNNEFFNFVDLCWTALQLIYSQVSITLTWEVPFLSLFSAIMQEKFAYYYTCIKMFCLCRNYLWKVKMEILEDFSGAQLAGRSNISTFTHIELGTWWFYTVYISARTAEEYVVMWSL